MGSLPIWRWQAGSETGECGNDVFSDPVAKEILGSVARQVLEGQNSHRGTLGRQVGAAKGRNSIGLTAEPGPNRAQSPTCVQRPGSKTRRHKHRSPGDRNQRPPLSLSNRGGDILDMVIAGQVLVVKLQDKCLDRSRDVFQLQRPQLLKSQI